MIVGEGMTEIYQEFIRVLTTYRRPDSKVVLALSGGVDSRVMLHMLVRYAKQHQGPVMAVHVNHGISPHAQHWAEQCRYWCQLDEVPCVIERVDLGDRQGESLENLARIARYRALSAHVGPDDLLLTGQHSDDQLETFILALKRGSGPRGLSAMAEAMPFGAGLIVRPLLQVTRQQIQDYAMMNGLSWVEDESNQDTHYDRNYIRHEITPLLEQRWPSIRQAVQRSATLCAQQESLLAELLNGTLQDCLDEHQAVSIERLTSYGDAMREQLLRMWLMHCHVPMPSYQHLSMIWHEVAMAGQDANPRLKLAEYEVRRFAGRLYLTPVFADVSSWHASLQFEQRLSLPDQLGSIQLSAHGLQPTINRGALDAPLWISFDPQGLMACPSSRSGRKKLKQLFQEYRVPSWLRRRIPILMCGQRVVCVANLFTERDFYGDECELIWDKSGKFGQN